MPLLAQTWPFPWPEDRIARYTARRASSPIVVDGRLDEADWQAAERSPRFADLIGGRPGIPGGGRVEQASHVGHSDEYTRGHNASQARWHRATLDSFTEQ